MTHITQTEANQRHLRRTDYVSCTVAFIDCKKPGSHLKENYSIIGPGVTSSSDQVINLPEAHGFNIGAAAMPHGIVNNLHIHFTAEVFMVYRGEWTFRWGPQGENTFVGREGDILSVPTWMFRGFVNTGPDDGWLFTTLGGDNTGGVIFHPDIIREAETYGMYLSRDNLLIDVSRGDKVPAPGETMVPMTEADIAGLRTLSPDEMRRRVVTEADRDFRPAFIDRDLPGCGGEIAPVIGAGITQNRDQLAPIMNPHGFSMEWLRLGAGRRVSPFVLDDKMVLILRSGRLRLRFNDDGATAVDLSPWDTYSVPAGVVRSIEALGDEPAETLVICSGDHRKRPAFSAATLAAAQAGGLDLDANGMVAHANLLPRYRMAHA